MTYCRATRTPWSRRIRTSVGRVLLALAADQHRLGIQDRLAEDLHAGGLERGAGLDDGEPAGLVVVAEHQTAGRGRLDRVWVTPPRAALTFSLLVAPDRVPVRAVAVAAAADRAGRGRRGTARRRRRAGAEVAQRRARRRAQGRRHPRRAGGAPGRCGGRRRGRPQRVLDPRRAARSTTATSLALAGGGLARPVRPAGRGARPPSPTGTTPGSAPRGAGCGRRTREACSTLGRDGAGGPARRGAAARPGRRRRRGGPAAGRRRAARVHALGAGDVVHVRPAGAAPAA